MRRKTCEHEERRETRERRTGATTDGRRGGSEGVRHSYQLRPRSSRDTTSENGQWNAAIGAQGDITSGGQMWTEYGVRNRISCRRQASASGSTGQQ